MGIHYQIRRKNARKKKDLTRRKIRTEEDGCYGLAQRMRQPKQEEQSELPLGKFEIPSHQGNEIEAMHAVLQAVAGLNLPAAMRDRLKTAVAEATMNAMEHGNQFNEKIPVEIGVMLQNQQLRIQISDQGGLNEMRAVDQPDLEAKLSGLQSPRGWGLFLIQNMVDELQVSTEGSTHTVTLIFHLPKP